MEAVDQILEKFKAGLTLDGRKRVFDDDHKLASEFITEKSDPEAYTKEFLIEPLLRLFEIEKLPEKHFKDIKGDLRKVDYLLKNQLNLKILAEAKPLNSDLFDESRDGGVNQIKGLFRLAEVKETYKFGIATDGLKWIIIDRNSKIVYKLNLETDFDKLKKILVGAQEVSSVQIEEEITARFYEWYNALLHGGQYKDHENKTRNISTKDCLIENIFSVPDQNEREQIAQTTLDRLIFIKFLQSKKIVSYDVLEYLLKLDDHIVNEKLKQIFFQVFNTPTAERINVDPKFKSVPYLNGSLFVRTEVEQRNQDYGIKSGILQEVIKFLDSFKFVHTEDVSNDKTLDPEILGFIFERAMTAGDRKGTGAYYTPKAITKYIAESTIYPVILKKTNNLLRKKGYKETELLTNFEDIYRLRESTLQEVFNEIVEKLKICDNACGSGAFLLAAANTLFDIYQRMNKEIRLENAEIALKKQILLFNLYGVDLNPNAIEIAKLRIWLWLVSSYDPEHIEPIPNIDYNLRVGNSLLGYVDISKFKENKLTLLDWANEEKAVSKLLITRQEKINKYVYRSGTEAKKLKQEIDDTNKKINKILDLDFYSEISTKVKISEEEYQKAKPFHWGSEFYPVFNTEKPKEERGFDVIIGNPPYVRIESVDHTLADAYKVLHESVYQRCDLYVAFIQTSYKNINQDGMIGLITANQYFVSEYGEKIRELITTKYGISKIINFTHYSVFPGVSIYTAILIGSKKPTETIDCLEFNSESAINFIRSVGLSDEIRPPDTKKFTLKRGALSSKPWVFKDKTESTIIETINSKSLTPLSKLSLIGSPLTTGLDEVLFQKITKEDASFYYLEGENSLKIEKGVWKKILKPRLLEKWVPKKPALIVFFPYKKIDNQFELLSENELKKGFPLTYKFLSDFKAQLLDRKDSRKTWKEHGRAWYSLHRVGIPKNYFGKKILTQSLVKEPTFCIESNDSLFPHGGIMGISPNKGIDPYFLLGYLNSNVVYYLLKSTPSYKRGGYISLDVGLLSDIPVPQDEKLAKDIGELTEKLVQDIEKNKGLEKKINDRIYRFFNIDDKERALIENGLN